MLLHSIVNYVQQQIQLLNNLVDTGQSGRKDEEQTWTGEGGTRAGVRGSGTKKEMESKNK